MLKLVLYFLLVTVLGCETFGSKKVKSEWQTLDEVKEVDCGTWPLNAKDFSADSVYVLKGSKTGFLADVTQRNGSPVIYYAPFQDDEKISLADIERRPFGSDSLIAGGGNLGGRLSAVIVLKKNNKSRIEVRSIEDNVVRASTASDLDLIRVAQTATSKSGFWLLYKTEGEGLSEREYKILFAGVTTNSSKLSLKFYEDVGFPSDSELLVSEDRAKTYVTWKTLNITPSKREFLLSFRELNEGSKTVGPTLNIPIEIKSDIESWQAVQFRDGILVAIIEGDSLVGQAVLKIAFIRINDGVANLSWVKEDALTNEHASVPVWAMKDSSAYLLLPKWVDEESTVASYKVGPTGFEQKNKALGIFPKGTRIMDTFSEQEGEDVYAIVRFRGRHRWRFDLCNLEDL